MKKTISLILVLALGVGVEVANADFFFGEPVNPGPPINTPYADYNVCISADGLELYVSSDRPGGLGYFDIWRSTRENADNPWGPPVNVQEINSRYNEVFPCLSADGLTLYFSDWYNWNAADDRPGGVGNHDLWMSTRASRNDPWGTPVNMGAIINSPRAEVSPSVSQDGQIIIFASNRSGGSHNYDLWMSTRLGAESDWAMPVNMGPAVNSSAYEGEVCLSPDGLALFFSSDRTGGVGSYDMWLTTRPSQAAAWSPPVNLGPLINTSGMDGAPSLSPDLKTLYFGSDKIGWIGGWDISEVPIVQILDFNGDGIVDFADMCIIVDQWGENYRLCDIGPMPWGDGIVDYKDLAVLFEYWLKEFSPVSLVAHWKLDETEGTIAHDSIGDNDGTLHGEPLWQPADGYVNGALLFDGMDDYVSTDFVLNPTDGPFSVFAWVRGGAAGQVILSQAKARNWLSTETATGALTTGLTVGLVPKPLSSQAVITDGDWHRVGVCWDGASLLLYVDGVEVAEKTQSSMAGSAGGLYIGAGKNLEAGSFFSGLIDDVRIYNRALSTEEIEELAR